jgi:methylmalonyl-CoA mutase
VHIIGISSLAGGHNGLVPEIYRILKREGINNTMLVVGGVVPERDHHFLKDHGVSFIFGPGTRLTQAAADIIDKIMAEN